MVKSTAFVPLFVFLCCASVFAQGPCSVQSSKLACVIPEEYGSKSGTAFNFTQVLYPAGFHTTHYSSDFSTTLQPLTADIGRQANLLPLASPSSGVLLTYDPSLKTFVTSTDSLGPILGERAQTVGRHRLFIGFSYQFFDFDQLGSINLHDFPAVLTHTDDDHDNSPVNGPAVTCSINSTVGQNLGGCAFVRDRIDTVNSIALKVNQYTSYITFGLTRRIDVSLVIPIENVRMTLISQDTIVLGTNGNITPTPGSPDATCLGPGGPAYQVCNQQIYPPPTTPYTGTNGPPYFFHLFKDCPSTSPASGVAGLASNCLNHTFPDPTWTGNGSKSENSASGIGDVVARVKWNVWNGERAGFAAGLDVRFATGDALNYLGSGSYGVRPFAVFSYRARISPHVLVGYEWNTDSTTAGDLGTGVKGSVPSDFDYTVGADARATKWLTGDFDIVGQRVFGTETVAVTSQQFLTNCGNCSANSTPSTVTLPNLVNYPNQSYNITNASMGIKVRPFAKVKLVFTANVLVRLDNGGLRSKAVPLAGLGYTF